jgi:hypothetical protein
MDLHGLLQGEFFIFHFFSFLEWSGNEFTNTDLFYQPRMMMDDSENGILDKVVGKGNRRARRKAAPVLLFPP